MASLDFPSNPTNGQTYALNGVTYYYNSTMGAWLTQLTSMNLSTSSNTQVLFNDAGIANGSSGLVFTKGSGNLGIGTTSPAAKLHIEQTGINTTTTVINTVTEANAVAATIFDFDQYTTVDGGGSSMLRFRKANGTKASPTLVGANRATGRVGSQIYDGTAFYDNCLMLFSSDGTPALGSTPGRIQFYTTPTGSTTVSERMRIDGSGNIGIGTTSPTCKLHLVTGGSSAVSVANRGILVTNDVGARLVLETTTAPANTKNFVLRSENGIFSVATLNDTGTAWVTDNAFNIAANGNIGIGITPTTRNNTRLQLIDGIGFPATQVASSDANTLDDYEEGTWTPIASTSSGAITSYTSSGHYVKIGKQVWIYARITITNVGTASGTLGWSGAPFINNSGAQVPTLVREESISGIMNQGFIFNGQAGGNVLNRDNGNITWGNNYTHVFFITYIT